MSLLCMIFIIYKDIALKKITCNKSEKFTYYFEALTAPSTASEKKPYHSYLKSHSMSSLSQEES